MALPTAPQGTKAPGFSSISNWGNFLQSTGLADYQSDITNLAGQNNLSFEDAAYRSYFGLPLTESGIGQSTGPGPSKEPEVDFMSRFGKEYPAMISKLETELNLPALRQSAFDLGNTVKNIVPTVGGATRGFDVNDNQRRRMIAAQQEKFSPLLQEATAQQQFAENEFGRRMGQELLPFQMENEFLTDRLAREFTGYQQDKQNALTELLAKMSQGQALTVQEQQQAHDLAMMEKQFEQQKQMYNLQQQSSNGVGTMDEWEVFG